MYDKTIQSVTQFERILCESYTDILLSLDVSFALSELLFSALESSDRLGYRPHSDLIGIFKQSFIFMDDCSIIFIK